MNVGKVSTAVVIDCYIAHDNRESFEFVIFKEPTNLI